jgi:hypothetical protein
MYDYAASFEDYLGGQSFCLSFADGIINRMPAPESLISMPKFEKRFPGRVHLLKENPRAELNAYLGTIQPDAFYAQQYGTVAGTEVFPVPEKGGKIKTLLHAVFVGTEPHWDAYTAISDSVPRSPGIATVPYIVPVGDPTETRDLRSEWGVPPNAKVFCRHGGVGTFDISFVHEAVCTHARTHPHDYIVFLGTAPIGCENDVKNIIHLEKNVDLNFKQRYLNSCDACIHARSDGETFGLGVAECSMAGKPVFTFAAPPPGAGFHLEVLGPHALRYKDGEGLKQMLDSFDPRPHKAKADEYKSLYAAFGPAATMHTFLTEFKIYDEFMQITNPKGLSWEGMCQPIIPL